MAVSYQTDGFSRKHMKKFSILALSSATVATAPAFAETTVNYATPNVELSTQTTDLSFAFGDVENLQAVAMSDEQMAETQGAVAVLPLLLLGTGGGAIGAWSNHYDSYKNTGKPASVSDTLKATGGGMLTGVSMYGGGAALKPAVGNPGNWVRYGASFSKTQNIPTQAIRWGSNKHHQQNIGNDTLRQLNDKLHNAKLPGNSWRIQDKGHFHLWKK